MTESSLIFLLEMFVLVPNYGVSGNGEESLGFLTPAKEETASTPGLRHKLGTGGEAEGSGMSLADIDVGVGRVGKREGLGTCW